MRILGVLLLAAILPLGGCAGIGTGAGTGPGAGDNVPQALADIPQNYIVFFAFGSAELDETAQSVVAQAAEGALQVQPVMIEIAGFSGEGPNARTSAQMANQRYAVVTDALLAHGLDSSLFARVELTDEQNVPDVAIRRIEIRLELP
jgi:outer membrane protein OmpA-like peptidoglycan-associated protein